MYRLGLAALRVAPACLHAPCLEGLEIAARGDLTIALLRGQPRLEVISLGAAEPNVAGAQRHFTVPDRKTLQHRLGVRSEFLERRIGIGRAYDLHQLHLVELVIADHAARVLARRPGRSEEHT